MRHTVGSSCLALGALLTVACQANRPPPRQAEQSRSETAPAMTPEQMEEVEAVLRRGLTSLNLRCYQAELDRRAESFEARANVQVLVQPNGRAGQIKFGETEMDATFRGCIQQVIETWEFPKLPESAWFTYPLAFSPAY
jgi:hypothetical protein